MPTRRGLHALMVALGLIAAGRIFGIVELYILGAATAALVAGAVVQVRRSRVRLDTARRLTPTRLFRGDTVEVEVTLANPSRRNTAVLTALDYVGRRRDPIRVPMGWIEAGSQAGFAYRAVCDQRGRHQVGPVQVDAEDSFGLAHCRAVCGDHAELLVYPSVENLAAPVVGGAEDSRGRAERPRSIPGPGGDFYALRPYEVGDDLRRVHWPSVARTGELMIRREETDHRRRLTVGLDLRRMVHSPDTLEAAVGAAASVLTAVGSHTFSRLVTGTDLDSGFGIGPDHVDEMLLRLALAGRTADANPSRLIKALGARTASGTLVVVAATPSPQADLMALAAMSRWYTDVTLILVRRPGWDPTAYGLAEAEPALGVRTISFVAGDELKPAWDRSLDPVRLRQ